MIEIYHVPQPKKSDVVPSYSDPSNSCEHKFEMRRMLCDNGATQLRKQCTKCGKGLPAVAKSTLSPQEQQNAPLYDRVLQENVWRAAREQRQSESGLAEGSFRTRWWRWYTTYLESPVWSRRRAAVLRRSGGLCNACGKPNATIAHHRTYEHVGAEPLYDLAAVCSSCHDQLHPTESNYDPPNARRA